MWIFWIIIILIAISLFIKPIHRWIGERASFWQALAAIAGVVVLYFGFSSMNLTRELFIMQNRPYIGIRNLSERNTYEAEKRRLAFRTIVHLYNSGNLPGELREIHLKLNYQGIGIDTLYTLRRTIYPKDSTAFNIVFAEDLLKRFENEVYNRYSPKTGYDYVNNLRFEFDIEYYSAPVDKNFNDKSAWMHSGDCDRYVQAN